MLRFSPRPSARAPKATPATMPATCTPESRKPALHEAQPEGLLQRSDRRGQLADVQGRADAREDDDECE